MKNFKWITLIMLVFSMISCNFFDDSCEIEISVVDAKGAPVAGALIEAYSSPSKNPSDVLVVYTQTDSFGHTKIAYNPGCLGFFKIIAYKGCSSNDFTENQANVNRFIKSNSHVTCILKETSTIVLKSNSNLRNSIFLNGQYLFDMDDKSTKSITVLAKDNEIRVIESNFLLSSPLEKTYDITSQCGDIKVLEFQ